ncbi:MAG: pseudaminic acid cytidylyltransferase [Culturomica sp.]|jgi:N-acylneuraminate cytidylyltransferase|nr:pseudaminic acid cytidylyltransferase [Culturomica sp.]
MKRIAIIPARGGSKRIPKKNIKPFLGKPVIAYSIEAAAASGLFDEVMVSTDDAEIARVAEQYGARIPFLRSEAASSDVATTADALIEVIHGYEKMGRRFDHACCLYPTAVFVTPEKLKEAFALLVQKNYLSVFPVMPFGYPVWRSLKNEDGKLSMNYPEYLHARSQDLPAAYHDAGQFYFFKTEVLFREKTLFTSNSGGIILSELEGQDIDNETDWQLAELKYQLVHKNG